MIEYIYTNPPPRTVYDTGLIFKQSTTGLIFKTFGSIAFELRVFLILDWLFYES